MIDLALLSEADASINQNSVPWDTGDLQKGYMTFSFSSGTLNGSTKIQGSPDKVTWFDVDSTTKTVTSGGGIGYDIVSVGFRYYRGVWTRTSGTGTVTVMAGLKENLVRNG
jgi:flavin-binding protein dodecin